MGKLPAAPKGYFTDVQDGVKKAEQESINKERERFKQDCRKRALEMAHSELAVWTSKFASAGVLHPNNQPSPDVMKLADKYYQWLISIPS